MTQFPYQTPTTYVSGSTVESQERERVFFASVYRWMFGGLLISALASMWVVFSPAMQKLVLGNRMVFFGICIAEVVLVMYASLGRDRISPAAAASCFLVYSLLTGLLFSFIFFLYSSGTIMQAFGTAAGMFLVMSIYARVTKKDLSSWRTFLFMGVIGIVIAMVINMFIGSSALDMAISTIAVFVFTGLIAYKTQSLRQFAHAGGPRGETYAIYGALTLYISFLNLFIHLLRLFGGSRRN